MLNLATEKAFITKSHFSFDHNNWYVNSMESPFFPTEIEARREHARIGLINKLNYHPQLIQFDVIDDTHWQAIIEAKQGRFQLDCYRPFAFQHGNIVYNPRDRDWIPNATDNPWANCPGKNPEHEYHVIQTLGWSLHLLNIKLSFDVKSESIYYGKTCTKCDLEGGYCPPNQAIKATVNWELNNHCRLFDVCKSYARIIKFQKRFFIETLENSESNPGHKHNAHMYSRSF